MSAKFESSSERGVEQPSSAEAVQAFAPGKQTRVAEHEGSASAQASTTSTQSSASVQRKASSASSERAGDWSMSEGMMSAMGLSSPSGAAGPSGAVQLRAAGTGTHAVQARGDLSGADVAATADRGVAGASAQLPYHDQIQQSFGRHDISGIRAQVGGEAAAASSSLGAEAYATGDRVAFARAPDLHTAAHEAAHVVQQAGGGVQLKDGIGQAGDVYEQHADAVADAVVAGKSAEGLLDRHAPAQGSSITSAGTQKKAVQRKLGFEFESVGDTAWRFHGRMDPGENWAGISHTKEIILLTPNGRAGLGADTGRVEVITKPLSTWADIVATFGELQTLLARFSGGAVELVGPENDAAKAVTGMNHHRVTGRADFAARPQATFGMAPLNTEALFRRFMAMNQNPQDETEQALASDTLVYQMDVSISAAKQILTAALAQAGTPARDYEGLVQDEMAGALMLILKTLWDAYSNSGPGLTDPKYAFPMMPRTDFKSMVRTLEPGSRDLLLQLWNGGAGALATQIDNLYQLDSRVFTGGYKDANKKKQRGPTKREWLNSIFTGADPKDLLSPPPGYPAHNTTPRPEGLGAYKADGHLALFELRDIMGKAPIPFGAWLPLARKVAEVVAQVENDDELRPR